MTLWSPPFIYNIAGPVNSITAGPIAFTKPVGILGVKGASAAGASLGTNVGLGVVLAPVAIVAAVLALGALYNAIRAEEIKRSERPTAPASGN
ncbi:MAG: hypothetical protein IPK03_05840 [Bacteroidetes bacterium]|nr:hypothetical protein [Bacteroidota bacterium]